MLIETCQLKIVVCGSLLFCLAGCNDTPKPMNGPAGHAVSTKRDDRCDDWLNSAFDMLQPDRLGISSDPQTAVDLLNRWLPACETPQVDQSAADPAAEALLEKLLSAAELQRARHPRFVSRDAGHIRDALLHKATIHFAAQSAENDLERVVQLFGYVVRNIQLVDASLERIPLTPYHVLLFGNGTAEDRAWIFANLLRQLRIDSVILRPRSKADTDDPQQAGRRWLIGVLLDEQVYLFDTRLGWPVPSAADSGKTPTVRQPATLSEALANSDVLKRLDVDAEHPYPLRADDLKSLRVELIGHTGFWSARMKQLQMSLSGDRSVVVSDPLQDGETGDGLVTRVVEFGKGKWQADDVAVWPYPERQLDGFANLNDSQAVKLRGRERRFDAPLPLAFDPQKGQVVQTGDPSRTQLKKRTAQLLGDHQAVIRAYLMIRFDGKNKQFVPAVVDGKLVRVPVPRRMRRMHEHAAEDAFVWIGVCQFEQAMFDTAANTFRDYLRRHPQGAWVGLSRGLLALSEAEQGNFAEAAETLEAVPKDDPHRDGSLLLIRRWRNR